MSYGYLKPLEAYKKIVGRVKGVISFNLLARLVMEELNVTREATINQHVKNLHRLGYIQPGEALMTWEVVE